MLFFRALTRANILTKELYDVIESGSKWVWLLLGIAGLIALVEAGTLANLLILGYVVLDQEVSGPLSGILENGGLGELSKPKLLVVLGSTLVALVTLRFSMFLTYRYLALKWGSIVVRNMHEKIMRGMILAPLQLFDKRDYGGMVFDSMNAPLGASAAVENTTALLSSVFLICTFVIMLVLISPWLLIIAIAISILWFTTIVPQSRKRVKRLAQQKYDRQADGTKVVTDTINGIREIRALSSEMRWVANFSHSVDLWETARVRMSLIQAISPAALQMMLQIGFAAAIIFAAIVLSSAELTTQLPILGTFAYALFRIYPVVGQISQSWISLAQILPNLSAAAEWTELPEDPLASGSQIVDGSISSVRFDHVWFSYNENEPTIVDADFCMEAGKITALVGASGAGKSTIIDLLLKFRAPDRGVLWIGNQNQQDLVRRNWLDRIALVRQDVFLFSGTIRENLLEYKPDATEEELRLACHQAGALEFIDAMPDGLDAKLGERGMTLSGGQRQRIAISRALLRNSDVLILDEAMSALDGETEAQVLESLLAGSSTRIIVLISHRLATVRHADHIVVIDRGRVVDQGTHEQLLTNRGRYWELFFTQMGQDSAELADVIGSQAAGPELSD